MPTIDGPSYYYFNHTPHDTNNLPNNVVSRGILVNAEGNVVTLNASGASVTHYGLLAGVIYPIRTHRILDTGTTATGITVYH